MTENIKNAGSFETLNPDRREAVRELLEEEIGAKNVEKFLEGEYEGKTDVLQKIADKLSLSRNTIGDHINTLKLSEDHGWILEMADGNTPTIVKALGKEPSDRTETEENAVEEKFEKESGEVPCVAERSNVLPPMRKGKFDALGFRCTAMLTRELDRLRKLPFEEQVTVILETLQEGSDRVPKALEHAETRVEREDEDANRPKTRTYKIGFRLSEEPYEILKDYANFKDIPLPSQAAEDIVLKFVEEEVRGRPEITPIR